MLEGQITADFIVHDDGTDRVGLQLAANHGGRDAAFFQIPEQVDIEKEPVGNHDQPFDAAVEQKLKIALEAGALVVHVGEDGKVRRLVKRVFDATQHQRAKRIGHVEHHDSDGVAALAAQGAGKLIRPVAKFLGGALDPFLGDGWNVTRQGSVIEDDGNCGGGESALLGNVSDGDHRNLLALSLDPRSTVAAKTA